MARFIHSHLFTIIAKRNKYKHDLDRVSGSLCQLNPNHLLQNHFFNPTLNVLMSGAWAGKGTKECKESELMLRRRTADKVRSFCCTVLGRELEDLMHGKQAVSELHISRHPRSWRRTNIGLLTVWGLEKSRSSPREADVLPPQKDLRRYLRGGSPAKSQL